RQQIVVGVETDQPSCRKKDLQTTGLPASYGKNSREVSHAEASSTRVSPDPSDAIFTEVGPGTSTHMQSDLLFLGPRYRGPAKCSAHASHPVPEDKNTNQ
ncbi:hypothetical protein STEG23_003828, partial [Scotinomys teguina]